MLICHLGMSLEIYMYVRHLSTAVASINLYTTPVFKLYLLFCSIRCNKLSF